MYQEASEIHQSSDAAQHDGVQLAAPSCAKRSFARSSAAPAFTSPRGVGKRLRYVLAEPHTPEGSASKGGSGASERPPRGSAKMNSVIEAAPAGMKKHYEGYGVRR
jgi:hypothetical protein